MNKFEKPEEDIQITLENENTEPVMDIEADMQIRLMQRHLGKDFNTDNEIKWIDRHSDNFRQIFRRLITEDLDLAQHYRENPQKILDIIDARLPSDELVEEEAA